MTQIIYVDCNWGDILMQIGQYLHKYPNTNFIVMTNLRQEYTEGIIKFLEMQPFIEKVIHIPNIDNFAPINAIHDNMLLQICNEHGIDISSIDSSFAYGGLPHYFYEDTQKFILSEEYTSKTYNIENIEDYVLIQPFSPATSNPHEHYIHWHAMVENLCSIKEYRYIFLGLLNIDSYDFSKYNGDNIINKTGDKSIDNIDVFNISNKTKFTITTANSLAVWCMNQNNKSCIFGTTCSDRIFTNYFNSCRGIRYFSYNHPLITNKQFEDIIKEK